MNFKDVEQINYLLNNNYHLHHKIYTSIPRVVYKYRTIRFLYILISSIKQSFLCLFQKSSLPYGAKVWVAYQTKNNYDVLNMFNFPESSQVKIGSDFVYKTTLFYQFVYCLPLFIYLLRKNKIKLFPYYLENIGYVEQAVNLLRRDPPQVVVFANDHSPAQVALRIAAQKLSIKTFYFQHAHITESFPPLRFDYSFLEGNAAKDVYQNIAPINGQCFLIGNIKALLNQKRINRSNVVKKVGIAFNTIDDPRDVLNLAIKIKTKLPDLEITIRPHPIDKRNIPSDKRISVSNPGRESAIDFLNQVDFLIAGNSSIHLEATLLNIVSVYFDFSTESFIRDYYGFIKNQLIQEAMNIETLFDFLEKETKKKTNVLNRSEYYNSKEILNPIDFVYEKTLEIIQNHG